jgi:hypothetical protein
MDSKIMAALTQLKYLVDMSQRPSFSKLSPEKQARVAKRIKAQELIVKERERFLNDLDRARNKK